MVLPIYIFVRKHIANNKKDNLFRMKHPIEIVFQGSLQWKKLSISHIKSLNKTMMLKHAIISTKLNQWHCR